MKGEINKIHLNIFSVKNKEDKDNGRTDIKVVESFTMVDAKRYKEAKDSIERLSPEYRWMITQYKIQQIFYKSFVLDEDDRKIV